MPGQKTGSPVLADEPSLLRLFAPALAQALPVVAEIVADGWRTRHAIRTAVRAIAASHELRMEAVDFVEGTLNRYGVIMSPELRDAYLTAVLRLADASFYVLPWNNILPPRR
jgi:hypothetical protein